jgi:hypothetical protein
LGLLCVCVREREREREREAAHMHLKEVIWCLWFLTEKPISQLSLWCLWCGVLVCVCVSGDCLSSSFFSGPCPSRLVWISIENWWLWWWPHVLGSFLQGQSLLRWRGSKDWLYKEFSFSVSF